MALPKGESKRFKKVHQQHKHEWTQWNPIGFTKKGHAHRLCRLCGMSQFTHDYKGK